MKQFFVHAVVLFFAACSAPRQTILSESSTHQAKTNVADSVTFAKLTFEADQKDFLPQMLGQWVIHTMQRQARLPEETLNLFLQLNEDRTYKVSTACGDITGTYVVKGVSIRFENANDQHGKCENKEQLDEMTRLLTERVSLYTVSGNMLFLKDNSSNNVFRITR